MDCLILNVSTGSVWVYEFIWNISQQTTRPKPDCRYSIMCSCCWLVLSQFISRASHETLCLWWVQCTLHHGKRREKKPAWIQMQSGSGFKHSGHDNMLNWQIGLGSWTRASWRVWHSQRTTIESSDRNTERPLQRFNCTLCCGNPEREIEGPCADQLSPNKCQLMDNGLGLDFEILPENPQKLSLPFISLLFHLVWRRLVQMPASNAD